MLSILHHRKTCDMCLKFNPMRQPIIEKEKHEDHIPPFVILHLDLSPFFGGQHQGR
jgi:hypothetical protein